jgi:hypothetical protein
VVVSNGEIEEHTSLIVCEGCNKAISNFGSCCNNAYVKTVRNML